MSKYPVNLFLPAAGLGVRLRPITKHLPKPLLPILGKPIIGLILGKLISICDGKIGVNLHYHQDMVRRWFQDSPYEQRVTFFPENPILGTGGALKNAEAFLSGGPFLVHNADILLDIPFSKLIEAHLSSGNIATLVTHRHPLLSNVVIDENDCVVDVENPGASQPDRTRLARKVAFTGIALYSPEILQFLPAGESHATTAWLAAARAGRAVKTMDVTGSYWNDVGNPATYAAAVMDTLRTIGETFHQSPGATVGNIDASGYVVIERGGSVQDGSRLRNCIVMPGANVSGSNENCIIGPDYRVQLTDAQMQPSAHAALAKDVGLSGPLFASFDLQATGEKGSIGAAVLIGFGGSDRRYYRVRKGAMTAVLMECGKDDPDYDRHVSYTTFFAARGVPVPRLLGTDARTKRAVFEDLGDLSLYTFLRYAGPDRVEEVYRAVIDILVRVHGPATDHVHECTLLASRVFDYSHLRWETTYFLEQFVSNLRHAAVRDRDALDDDFDRLARNVNSFLPTVIHRDFQSQNIMLHDNVPRVIDYQGARMAPPAYDVASFIWDPYARLDDGMRERLLGYYLQAMKTASKDFEERTFLETLIPCRLQRHMQALGAYAFLSQVKGKRYFLRHVPAALRLLSEEAELVRADYPALHELVRSLV
jgi:NDP-sugar pyrophosphorylase family protein/aminoglycoside/choline kinase family phosphotransferase